MVRDAYVTMLEHLSSNKLVKFKTKLEQLLNEGEGFVASSAHSCARSCLLEFDQESKGIQLQLVKRISLISTVI